MIRASVSNFTCRRLIISSDDPSGDACAAGSEDGFRGVLAMSKSLNRVGATFAFLAVLVLSCFATGAMAHTCNRPLEGSEIKPPPDIYSVNGVLDVTLDYYTTVDAWGRTLFCYVTPDGMEAPTLHVNPGDRIKIRLRNKEPTAPLGSGVETVSTG